MRFKSIISPMRALITFLTTVAVATLLALDNPRGFFTLLEKTQNTSSRLWNEKEIRIDGLQLLSRTEVERQLPLDRSVLWWHLNVTKLQAALAQTPWIGDVTVSSCPDVGSSHWGCFLLQIQERKPTFIADFGGDTWVIGHDGSFLVPLDEFRNRNYSGDLIRVGGIPSHGKSPNIVQERLSVAFRLCEKLEQAVAKRVVGLKFLDQGDLAIEFKDVPFPIVFAAGEDAKVSIEEQGERCAVLLTKLGGRFSEIEKIDLAFNRVGVVKLKAGLDVKNAQ